MSNVIVFRSKASACSAHRSIDPGNGATVRLHPTRRPVLVAIWQRNATTGRLECRWSSRTARQLECDVSAELFIPRKPAA